MAAKKATTTTKKADTGGFRGFGSQALPFLAALRDHNDRDWFAANKGIFLEELDGPFRELIGEVGGRLASLGSVLAPLPRNPVYRIYRDVRFSKDKSPYKTNLGAGLHRGGDKKRPGLVYIHVEPAGSFVAAGFYQPEPPLLQALRAAIAANSDEFLKLVAALESRGITFGSAEPLTRMPKGFEDQADSPVAGLLRYRSFIVARPIPDDDLERRDLAETLVEFATTVTPFLEFCWSRIEPD